jgi:hypothetical protein
MTGGEIGIKGNLTFGDSVMLIRTPLAVFITYVTNVIIVITFTTILVAVSLLYNNALEWNNTYASKFQIL